MVPDIDPRDWRPRWRMDAQERAALEEFRSSLADSDAVCFPCFDTGLPCYHVEPLDTDVIVLTLIRFDGSEAA